MQVTLKIRRYNPETDDQPYYQDYLVEVDPNERLLDALMEVKRFQDGSLAFRKSCAHGVCGSDAMRINGRDGLACKTLIKDVATEDKATVVLEPLRHFPVQRDLIVDQSEFFRKYREVKPFLIADAPPAAGEFIQSQEQRLRFDDATNCILCASCYSACPMFDEHPEFLGPAALVQAFRFLADSRDRGLDQRLPVLDQPGGVWRCQNHFQCTLACPRSILITKRINETKRMVQKRRDEQGEPTHPNE